MCITEFPHRVDIMSSKSTRKMEAKLVLWPLENLGQIGHRAVRERVNDITPKSPTHGATSWCKNHENPTEQYSHTNAGFIKRILRGVRCTKSLRVLFLHRQPPSWTTLVLYSRAVFIFNEPALRHLQTSWHKN